MINFLNLGYFLMAVEELSFIRAARKFYISQQLLSNHISNLEKEFDMILFNRTSLLILTYTGRALKTRAGEPLGLWDETYKEISDIKDFSTGQLSISISRMRGGVILPEILPTYQSQFSDIELHLVEGNSNQLASDLPHGGVDLIIDLPSFTAENVEIVPICNEGVLTVIPGDVLEKVYPGQMEEMKEKFYATSDIRILEHCPFVLLRGGNRVHIIMDKILEDAQMSPRTVLGTEGIEAMLALNGKGMGITFYPKMFMSPDPASRSYHNVVLEQSYLNLYSLNYMRAHGVLGISYHKGRYTSRAAHEFMHIAKEWLDYASKK